MHSFIFLQIISQSLVFINKFSCQSSSLVAVSIRHFVIVMEPVKCQSLSSTMFYVSLFYSSMLLSLLLSIQEIPKKWCLLFLLFPYRIIIVLQNPFLIHSIPIINSDGIVHFGKGNYPRHFLWCWMKAELLLIILNFLPVLIGDVVHDALQFIQSKTFPRTHTKWNIHFSAWLNKYLLLANGIQKCSPYVQRDQILKEKTSIETSNPNTIWLVPDVLTRVWKLREEGKICPSAVWERLRKRSGKIFNLYSL